MRYDPEQANKSKRVAYLKGYDEGYKQGTDDTVKRFLLHQDNAGFAPIKVARYEKLLAFVKGLSDIENAVYGRLNPIDIVNERAKELLQEIGE